MPLLCFTWGVGKKALFLFSFKKYLIRIVSTCKFYNFTTLLLYPKYNLEHQQVLTFGIGVECLITHQKYLGKSIPSKYPLNTLTMNFFLCLKVNYIYHLDLYDE